MVKADVYSISALFQETAREPSGKEEVLPELVLQPKKTTKTPRGEHMRFSVGASEINRIPVALERKKPNSLLPFLYSS